MADRETFLNGRVVLHGGDCLDILRTLPDASLDTCVCDPPYALVSIGKRLASPDAAAIKDRDGAYARAAKGFMGKAWDTGDRAFAVEFWAEVYRVLKPGAYLAAFGGTRSWHRMVCAIEDAGFEIRDSISYLSDGGIAGPLLWTYGAGFPKSHDPAKHLRERICTCGAPRQMESEAVDVMRKVRPSCEDPAPEQVDQAGQRVLFETVPCQDSHGTPANQALAQGALGLDGCELRVRAGETIGCAERGMEGGGDATEAEGQLRQRPVCEVPASPDEHVQDGRICDGASAGDGRMGGAPSSEGGVCASPGSPAAEQPEIEPRALARQPKPQNGGAWPHCSGCGKPIVPDGLGTALKPAWEPICLARKSLEGTIAENVLAHGTGALNIAGCRVGMAPGESKPIFERSARDVSRENYRTGGGVVVGASTEGRWPANVLHDGSDVVVGAFPEAPGQQRLVGPEHGAKASVNVFGDYGARDNFAPRGDGGSAARFFYSGKADSDDRIGSKHPTVKPVDLMRWIVRLVTPPGGTVLDPFAGTGTTGEAAFREGFSAVLVEREVEYRADIARRMALCLAGPDERARAIIKEKLKDKPVDHGPLFGGLDGEAA